MKACLIAILLSPVSFDCQTFAAGPVPIFGKGSVVELRAKAEMGDADAQVELGAALAFEDAESMKEAVHWYRKAALQDHAQGQYFLAYCLSVGRGIRQDKTESVNWYRKAAEQGHTLAQHGLAFAYLNGSGVPKDYVLAYKWAVLAAAKNTSNAGEAETIANAARMATILEKLMDASQVAEAQKMARGFIPRPPRKEDRPNQHEGKDALELKGSGTGFSITEDGHFITNQHVAGEGATVRLVTPAGIIAAKVVKVDKANDLALLKAEGKFTALPVIASRGVRLGATAATVGFPNTGLQGFAPKLARGEIASLAGAQDDARHFQISAPIQPGNSGGALVDERGNVIGVVVAKLSQRAALATSGALAENVNYAVKSSYLLSFLESVPEVAAKLKEAHTRDRKFEDVVKSVEQATVLVLVY